MPHASYEKKDMLSLNELIMNDIGKNNYVNNPYVSGPSSLWSTTVVRKELDGWFILCNVKRTNKTEKVSLIFSVRQSFVGTVWLTEPWPLKSLRSIFNLFPEYCSYTILNRQVRIKKYFSDWSNYWIYLKLRFLNSKEFFIIY